jgi:hypothetical protein
MLPKILNVKLWAKRMLIILGEIGNYFIKFGRKEYAKSLKNKKNIENYALS